MAPQHHGATSPATRHPPPSPSRGHTIVLPCRRHYTIVTILIDHIDTSLPSSTSCISFSSRMYFSFCLTHSLRAGEVEDVVTSECFYSLWLCLMYLSCIIGLLRRLRVSSFIVSEVRTRGWGRRGSQGRQLLPQILRKLECERRSLSSWCLSK